MDIMSCSINSYLKNMDMQFKWQQNQASGNYRPSVQNTQAAKYRTVDEWVGAQREKSDDDEEKKNKQLNEIKNKYLSGKVLTQKEKNYLQINDPAAYARMQAAETAGKIYENQLMTCRTKDDVNRYKMSHCGSALSNIKSIMSDRSMSQEEKLNAVMTEKKKMDAVNKAEWEFIKRGDYARLPSMAEKMKAERDMRRAKAEEAREAREKEAAKKAEREEWAARAREKREAEKARREEKRQEKKAERDAHAKSVIRKRKIKRLSKSRKKMRFKKARFTTQQAANTYEARKVRNANARAAAARSYISSSNASADTGKSLDVSA
ncbi:MAG: hypothetical protein J1F11_08545 [Oscillospiraceae bacterium]|nr:hypothetical protein [Oscillospiraceae bacterium]